MVSPKNNRIFIWKDFSEWKPDLEGMFPNLLTQKLKDKARQSTTDIKDDEDIDVLDILSDYSIESLVDLITTEKINEFRPLYSHIRVYHACRTTNVQSYKENGILFLSKKEQIERFRSIFLSGDYPELTEEMLKKSIHEIDSIYKEPENEIFLGLDDKWILDVTGHYLIYGSEYLLALVAQLPIKNTKPYRSVLRTIGKPTFIEINLPNTHEYVRDSSLRQLIYEMIRNWVYNIAHSKTECGWLDFTFSIYKPLPPEHICDHYHPTKIPDPHMGKKIYNVETDEYEDTDWQDFI